MNTKRNPLTGENNSVIFCIFIVLIISVCAGESFAQTQQSYLGSYVQTIIKSEDAKYPNPFPIFLKTPKDTILKGNSSMQIPFIVNYFDASFNGTLILDFPAVTPLGVWDNSNSNTNFLSPLLLPVKLTGILTLPSSGSNTTYSYEIRVVSPYSRLGVPCSTGVSAAKNDKAVPGTYNIELSAMCPINILDNTYYYDYMFGVRFSYHFNPLLSFYIYKIGSTSACHFWTDLQTDYNFQRQKKPYLAVSTSLIELQTSTGDSARTKTLTVSNYGTDTLDFKATAATENGGNWLTISKEAGILKGNESVNMFLKINPGTLASGKYTGSVTFTSVKAANTPIVVQVTMILSSDHLLLKYDPPELKLGEWTSLNISVVDKDNNLINTFDGGATVNLLATTKEGLTNFSKTQSVLITKGKAQPLMIFTPDKTKPFDSVVTNNTVLSGPIVIEVRPENSQIKPDTAKIIVKSPIDFYIDSIDVQQGVANTDKEVTLEYKPGESKLFAARSFVAGHNTVVRAFVKYRKTTDISFNRLEYELKGDLIITAGGNKTIGPFSMGAPGKTSHPNAFLLKDNYDLNEQYGLLDAMFCFLKNDVFTSQGFYNIEAQIKYTSELDEKESEKANNKKSVVPVFQDSRTFRVMAVTGALEGENPPTVPASVWDYFKDAFPINGSKFSYTDYNSSNWLFAPTWYYFSTNYWNTLSSIFNRHNELSKPENQCEKLIMFATPQVIQNLAGMKAAGVAESVGGKICVIDAAKFYEKTVSHELGHLLGLKDTYDPYKVYNPVVAYFACGDPNPRRSSADFTGNKIENGNINLATLLKSTQKNILYDFMGRSSGDSSWIDRVTWDHLYKKFILNSLSKTSSTAKYVAVSGILKQNDTLILNKLITLDAVPYTDDSLSGKYAVEFLNSSGSLLKKNNFNLIFFLPDVYEAKEVPFNLYLTFPAGASKIQITMTDSLGAKKVLASRIFSANAPIVKLIAPTAKDSISSDFKIKWTASDADKDKLTFDLSYSPDGEKEYLIAVNLTDTVYQWVKDKYPLSKAGYITVVANDGYNDGKAKSEPFVVTGFGNNNRLDNSAPEGFNLEQCYPNPFNPATTITYEIPVESRVIITVYNLLGEVVNTPESSTKPAGKHEVIFNAGNLPSGVYFYSLNARPTNGKKEYRKIMKMVLIK